MANWFQEHPITTIIGHTILVATTTWLVSSFVIDENKVNLYRAQAENASAQIKSEQVITEQYKAKVSILEADVANLRSVNQRYLSWLGEEKHTFPSLEKKISSLEEQLKLAKSKVSYKSEDSEQPKTDLIIEPYIFKGTFSQGSSFIDPKTLVTLGVSQITPDYTVTGVLHIPGENNIKLDRESPGTTWSFEQDKKKYKLTLDSVNWLNNSFSVSVIEANNLYLIPKE